MNINRKASEDATINWLREATMEELYDYNAEKNQMKELSPYTYYKPFTSTFDREFFYYKFGNKPETSKQNEIPRRHYMQPSPTWSPAYSSSGVSSASPISPNNCTWSFRNDRTDVHEFSPGFYANLSSPTEKNLESHYDLISQGEDAHSVSSSFGTRSPENVASPFLTSGSFNFRDELNESLQSMDNISIASSVGSVSSSTGRRKSKRETSGYSKPMICNFCKNNKEVPDIFLNHYLYDPVTKVLSCPVLRKHVCEICGETGDSAHTLQYCPVNRERGNMQGRVAVLLKTHTVTNSTGKLRRN